MNVYKLDGDDLRMVFDALEASCYELRVAIDEGGVKFKVNNGTWSPALGSEEA
jgi:hypothetical protein